MRISIIVSNFNYATYLPEAIESALAQDYDDVEVIVVDDGSTDNSRQVIESYGSRILPVLKENGGQGSAFNSGFEVSTGDVICFLDSDDVFLSHKAALIAEEYLRNPEAVLFYHRLKLVDRNRRPSGIWPRAVWRGDIRRRVERSGGWWPCASTSGLCPTRNFLKTIMPFPSAPHREWHQSVSSHIWPDTYLRFLSPFFGPVIGIKEPLALYRIHSNNAWNFGNRSNNKERAERRLEHLVLEFNAIREVLQGRFAIVPTLSLEDNFRYQQYRMGIGETSKLRVLRTALRTPTLPPLMKCREMAKIVLGRN